MLLSFDNLGPKLSIGTILNSVTEEDIYKRWCAEFPSHAFNSPFRKDKNASFGFYKDGKWKWKDLGNGDGGDVFDFVARAENTDIPGAMQIVASVFNIEAGYRANRIIRSEFSKPTIENKKERSLIQVIRKQPTNFDIDYWNANLMPPPVTDFFGVRVAKEVWLKKPDWKEKKLIWTAHEKNPIYYWLSPFSSHIKVYRPFEENKRFKWLSNMDDATDVQGYIQCKIKEYPGRPMLLVKSLKEIGFFHAFGFNAMAPNAEGYIVNADFIRHLKKYCSVVLAIYDPDLAGVKGMKRLWKDHRIPGFVIPKYYRPNKKVKDPTDIWNDNYKKAYELINLINEYIRFLGTDSAMVTTTFGFHYS